jgi:hypothetical protein
MAIPIFAKRRYKPISRRLRIKEKKIDDRRMMMNSARKEI